MLGFQFVSNFERTVYLLKHAGFTNYVVIVAALSMTVKLCHMYPTMFFLPGRKKRDVPLPKGHIIAHRGSCSEGLPENTLASFTDAIAAGVHIVELDVWLTKDKKIVVHHDPTLTRMTAGTCDEKITDMDYDDLPSIVPGVGQTHRIQEICARYANGIHVPINKDYDDDDNEGEDGCLKAGSTTETKSVRNRKGKGAKSSANANASASASFDVDDLWKKIPTLEQVLDAMSDNIGLIIEVKDKNEELYPLLHKLIRSRSQRRQQNLYWFSLNGKIFNCLEQTDPIIPRCTHLLNIVRVFFLFELGLAPFIDIKADTFGVDVREVTKERVHNDVIFAGLPNWSKDVLVWLFRGTPTPHIFLKPKLYALLRRRGIPTYFLGINCVQSLHMAIELGAAGILTDKPNFMCAYMQKNAIKMSQVPPPSSE